MKNFHAVIYIVVVAAEILPSAVLRNTVSLRILVYMKIRPSWDDCKDEFRAQELGSRCRVGKLISHFVPNYTFLFRHPDVVNSVTAR